MPNNTFGGFSDEIDTGFERNQAVQSGTKAVAQGVKTVAKQVAQQVNPASDFVAQLYGVSTPNEEQGMDDHGNPVQKPQQNNANPHGAAKPQQTPQQQKQNEKHKMHDEQHGGQFKLEEELKKERARKQQEHQQRQQEEEEEIQMRAQAAQGKMSEIETPGGRKTGMQAQRSKKASTPMRRAPIAVERAKTKAEQNRGATG